MINEPYGESQVRVQSIEDCTPRGDEVFYVPKAYGGGFTILANATPSTALHIDVDKENVVPMVVRECGYDWVPVYTRKLT